MKRHQRLESNEEIMQRALQEYGCIPLHVRICVTDPLPLAKRGVVDPPPLPSGTPPLPEIKKGQIWDSPLGAYRVLELRWHKVWYELVKTEKTLTNRTTLYAFQRLVADATLRGTPPKPKPRPKARTGGQYRDLSGQMVSIRPTSPELAWALVRKLQEVCEFAETNLRLPELS
jgi:hypothetical protein